MQSLRLKSTWELVRALVVLRLCALPYFAEHSQKLMQWALRLGVARCLLKPTFYAQFVGGEDPTELHTCVGRLAQAGLRPMLAASLEEDVGTKRSDDVYDSNCQRILTAINMSHEASLKPMVQLKLSGLMPAQTLVSLGRLYNSQDNKLPIIEDMGNVMVSEAQQVVFLKKFLGKADAEKLKKALGRFKQICQAAQRKGVRVLVDAEHTHLNGGLSAVALSGTAAFNAREPVVWNTYQCYLKAAAISISDELNIVAGVLGGYFGAKLVRGAYMLQERQDSLRTGMPDPVCSNYNTTCKNYDEIMCWLLQKTVKLSDRCQFMAATHNHNSIQLAIRKIGELNVSRSQVSFGQLYGMCDHISYPLATAGYTVYKSIPYGKLEEVLPYLARRALENKEVLQGGVDERSLLLKELRSRTVSFKGAH